MLLFDNIIKTGLFANNAWCAMKHLISHFFNVSFTLKGLPFTEHQWFKCKMIGETNDSEYRL